MAKYKYDFKHKIEGERERERKRKRQRERERESETERAKLKTSTNSLLYIQQRRIQNPFQHVSKLTFFVECIMISAAISCYTML